jgi:hypothetical protein
MSGTVGATGPGESTVTGSQTTTTTETTFQEVENVGIEAVTVALSSGPQLLGDAENVFNDIAHGEGGVQKVKNAMGALALLLQHAEAALASVA